MSAAAGCAILVLQGNHERSEEMFTKTETAKRLAALTRQAAAAAETRKGYKVEVGLRCLPQTAVTLDEAMTRRYPEGDDLSDYRDRQSAASEQDVRAEGALVHLYLYERTYGEWELADVCVGWMGTATSEPVLLDTNGRPAYYGDHTSDRKPVVRGWAYWDYDRRPCRVLDALHTETNENTGETVRWYKTTTGLFDGSRLAYRDHGKTAEGE